jgi:hypothetical protein
MNQGAVTKRRKIEAGGGEMAGVYDKHVVCGRPSPCPVLSQSLLNIAWLQVWDSGQTWAMGHEGS